MVAPSRLVWLAVAFLVLVGQPAAAQQAGAVGTPPAVAVSQSAAPAPDVSAGLGASSGQPGFTVDQLVAIVGGALIGAVAADLVFHGGLLTLAGGVLGGMVGHWMYAQPPSAAPGAT